MSATSWIYGQVSRPIVLFPDPQHEGLGTRLATYTHGLKYPLWGWNLWLLVTTWVLYVQSKSQTHFDRCSHKNWNKCDSPCRFIPWHTMIISLHLKHHITKLSLRTGHTLHRYDCLMSLQSAFEPLFQLKFRDVVLWIWQRNEIHDGIMFDFYMGLSHIEYRNVSHIWHKLINYLWDISSSISPWEYNCQVLKLRPALTRSSNSVMCSKHMTKQFCPALSHTRVHNT